jgi:hypothetical protein
VTTPAYSLRVNPEGLARIRLEIPPGRPLAELVLMSSLHQPGRFDEVLQVEPVQVEAISEQLVEISQVARTTCWEHKRAVMRSYPDRLEYWCEVRGSGTLGEVQIFEAGTRPSIYVDGSAPSGWTRPARAREGWETSRAHFSRVFNPSPNEAFRQFGWPGERLSINPGNGIELPGRLDTWGGDWFFTPAPFAYGLGDEARWAVVGLGCRAEDANFYHYDYRGGPGFGFELTYQSHTRVDGAWRTPTVVILPASDVYHGLEAYCQWVRQSGIVDAPAPQPKEWWGRPIWCGWGEQVAREQPGKPAREFSSAENYVAWLDHLESQGLVPGTICIDDRWMARMGEPEANPRRWPDLAGFIAARQQRGQRVLLWHNVWEWAGADSQEAEDVGRPGGSGPEIIRRANGPPVVGAFGALLIDPTSTKTERYLRRLLAATLAPRPHGYGADGLKLDITHSTPSEEYYWPLEPNFRLVGASWGNALLHRLLSLIYQLVKEINPSAMVECHAANPMFRDTADVLRLNDLHTDLESVVEMMRHRGRVARAAGFNLVDCDGWPLPSRQALLEYVRAQPEIGIPALYYATRIDRSGERLGPTDYREIAKAWRRAG